MFIPDQGFEVFLSINLHTLNKTRKSCNETGKKTREHKRSYVEFRPTAFYGEVMRPPQESEA